MAQARKSRSESNHRRGQAVRHLAGPEVKAETRAPLISAFIDEGGRVVVQRVAESFGMSKGQLAETVGLGRETFHKAARAELTQ